MNWPHRIWRISKTAAVHGSQISAKYRPVIEKIPKNIEIFFFNIAHPYLQLPFMVLMVHPLHARLIAYHILLHLTKKIKKNFSPSLASSYLFEQCLRLDVTSTSSVSLPLQDESLYVFPNCKSLWIKASAKMTKCKCISHPDYFG